MDRITANHSEQYNTGSLTLYNIMCILDKVCIEKQGHASCMQDMTRIQCHVKRNSCNIHKFYHSGLNNGLETNSRESSSLEVCVDVGNHR